MKVFISWSGERSKQLAAALHPWMKRVLQRVDPWISLDDIQKGRPWAMELATNLDSTDVGIICVTRENKDAPWLLFEAGALSKRVADTRVIPYLLGIDAGELNGPLKTFQASRASKEDTKSMMATINALLGADGLRGDDFPATFDKWWPDLEASIQTIPDSPIAAPPAPSTDERIAKIEASQSQILSLLSAIQSGQAADAARRGHTHILKTEPGVFRVSGTPLKVSRVEPPSEAVTLPAEAMESLKDIRDYAEQNKMTFSEAVEALYPGAVHTQGIATFAR